MAKSSRYFSEDELKCSCGCGGCEMDAGFLEVLDRVREDAGIPLFVNSGFRCVKRDAEVRGEGNHPTGRAVDIRAPDSQTRLRVVGAMIRCGIERIGVAKGFVHGDLCADRPFRVLWLY